MKIAVLSGKGGTGKTFVSTNLSSAVLNCTYVDCDIEEPNGFLFLKPKIIDKKKVYVDVPEIDFSKCIGCRKCVSFCKFNALAFIKGAPKVFPEICHSCGGCKIACKSDAISYSKRPIGVIEFGKSSKLKTLTGILNNDEATGVPIIKELLSYADADENVIIDCPPGSACSVMESIKTCDCCLLIAEPTAFGVENLKLVAKLAKMFGKPCSIVINKYMDDNDIIENFAKKNNIDIILKIPFDEDIGSLNSQGKLAIENECFKNKFLSLYEEIVSSYEKRDRV